MGDYHIHIKEGLSSETVFNAYVKQAIDNNLSVIVLLEHGPRIIPKHKGYLDSKETIDEYKKIISSKNYPIKILTGIEFDYSCDQKFRENTIELIKYGNFDFVIGAVHGYKDKDLTNYYLSVIDMLKFYELDSIAHIILDENYLKYENLIEEIFLICSNLNIAIEINTADRQRWTDEQLNFMLKKYKKHDVKYVIGSDAHKSDEVGYKIKFIKEKINEMEFKL